MVRELLITAIGLSSLVGLCRLTVYRSESRGSKIAISMILLFTVASPLVSAVGAVFDLCEGGFDLMSGSDISPSKDIYKDTSEAAFREGVASYISQKCGIDEGCITVITEGYDQYSLSCEEIRICLSGSGAVFVDVRGLREAVKSEIMKEKGECVIEIDPNW